ncbi:hypothetical protein ACJQWK_10558 [Exserohilum turcicum]
MHGHDAKAVCTPPQSHDRHVGAVCWPVPLLGKADGVADPLFSWLGEKNKSWHQALWSKPEQREVIGVDEGASGSPMGLAMQG